VSGFSADWLALREPHDHAARNPELLQAVARLFQNAFAISVIDLACGAGSTLRALARHLPARQSWRLVDNDLSLLARAAAGPFPDTARVTATPIDLVHDVESALDGPLDLVTTSALLDLVSKSWLERLATEVAARRLPFYAALSYDGRIELSPAHEFDVDVTAAVNRHQRSDKGFGPALGPVAVEATSFFFDRAGYQTSRAPSDWVLGNADRRIQAAVIQGWHGAAAETDALTRAKLDRWLSDRIELIEAGRSSLRVGHEDLLARPRRD
jgi:hypothetical protein